MCGRYVFYETLEAMKRFHADPPGTRVVPRYNAAPSQDLPIVLRNSPNHIECMRWGLIPSWAKDPKIGYKLINARAETVAEKPSFRHAFKSQRCLVPANGFYEWELGDDGKTKLPFYIRRKDQQLFGMAGLWEEWKDAQDKVIRSFTIITTTPNAVMRPIHDRMPVILRQADEAAWLDPDNHNVQQLQSFLNPSTEQLEAIHVSKIVNSPEHEGAQLIEPDSE